MKIFNIIFCFLFLVSAALQYNDPDPWLWMPIYLFGSLVCLLAVKKKFYQAPMLAGILIYSVYAVYLFFADDGVAEWISEHDAENIAETMQAAKPWIEETREFFGLLILCCVLLINYFYAKRNGLLKKMD